jgi:hypothetical protein
MRLPNVAEANAATARAPRSEVRVSSASPSGRSVSVDDHAERQMGNGGVSKRVGDGRPQPLQCGLEAAKTAAH